MSAVPAGLASEPLTDVDSRQRRMEPRFSVDQEGYLRVRGSAEQSTPIRIRNISSSGMQVEASCSIALASRVRIHWRGHIIDGEICNETPLEEGFQLGVRLFAPWELLVKEVLASQSEELSIAKTELEQRNRSLAAALETARDAAAGSGFGSFFRFGDAQMTEKRSRQRLLMASFCRVAPAGSRRRGVWKRIENISGAGMLMEWSRSDQNTEQPRVGDRYAIEMELLAHPRFGQRSMSFVAKVVRVFRSTDGRVMAGLQANRSRIKAPKPPSTEEVPSRQYVN